MEDSDTLYIKVAPVDETQAVTQMELVNDNGTHTFALQDGAAEIPAAVAKVKNGAEDAALVISGVKDSEGRAVDYTVIFTGGQAGSGAVFSGLKAGSSSLTVGDASVSLILSQKNGGFYYSWKGAGGTAEPAAVVNHYYYLADGSVVSCLNLGADFLLESGKLVAYQDCNIAVPGLDQGLSINAGASIKMQTNSSSSGSGSPGGSGGSGVVD